MFITSIKAQTIIIQPNSTKPQHKILISTLIDSLSQTESSKTCKKRKYMSDLKTQKIMRKIKNTREVRVEDSVESQI